MSICVTSEMLRMNTIKAAPPYMTLLSQFLDVLDRAEPRHRDVIGA